jgi:hypothetical protein
MLISYSPALLPRLKILVEIESALFPSTNEVLLGTCRAMTL